MDAGALPNVAALYFGLVNLATFVAFRVDKRRAELGDWRIPERRLLTLALIGGSPAALLARRVLRHKTRKQPFSTLLWLIVMVQVGLAIWLLASLG